MRDDTTPDMPKENIVHFNPWRDFNDAAPQIDVFGDEPDPEQIAQFMQVVRAKYQRLCRHALYSRGCRLDIETFFVGGTASAHQGLTITISEAALLPNGWFRGGVLRHADLLGFIAGHVGDALTLSGRMPDLEAAIDDPEALALVEIAPGCDLRRDTCKAKFGNLLNFGGFPDIPGRNPFGGTSIV